MDGTTPPLPFLKRGSCLRRADWEGSSWHFTCRLISQHQAVKSLVRAYLKISPERISGDLAGEGDLFGNLVLKRAIDVGLRYEIPLAPFEKRGSSLRKAGRWAKTRYPCIRATFSKFNGKAQE